FSEKNDFNSERVILNQLVEIAWWAKEDSTTIGYLTQGISLLLVDSRSTRGLDRIKLFNDFIEIITRFPESSQVYAAVSTSTIELIKWGSDDDILNILEIIQEKAAMFPLVETIQLLDAKVFMNTLFYLDEQDCKTILHIYNQFSSFAISNFEDDLESSKPKVKKHILGEEVNDILQEGAINAIISMARANKKNGGNCNDCLLGIRRIIQDSDYLLRREGKVFFQDIYRLSYALDTYKLWEEFSDFKLIADLKIERDKNQMYQTAEIKLLAIQKNMRIEEYDSLKIGRRGLSLAYNPNDIQDVEKIIDEITSQDVNSLKSINIVDEIDAVIDYDTKLKEHLRETGQIPADRETIDEIQDKLSLNDDLTVSATKESKISEQLEFLKQLEIHDERLLENQMLHAKSLILAVGMHGFNSPILQITTDELVEEIESLCKKKMIVELVDSLVRAVTLRAARLDGYAVTILFEVLNRNGLKFLSRYYKQYNFSDNIVRLISYLGRTGNTDLLQKVKNEMDKANRIILHDDEINLKIIRALNEGILAYSAEDAASKLKLIQIGKEIAKVHSFDVNIQIKYVESLNFALLDLARFDLKTLLEQVDELIEFANLYSKNEEIEEKAALGLLWSLAILKLYNRKQKIDIYQKRFEMIINAYPQSEYLQQLESLKNKKLIG
ncbi:MAG: hypothetical protein ACTSSH_09240, partial [Candidatus Heimdallarchaeota archaeon]